MLGDLLRVLWGLFSAAPLLTIGGVWWLTAAGLQRVAKTLKVPPWIVWLGPIAGAYILWKRRQGRLAVALLVAVWLVALAVSPQLRFAVGVALPTGAVLGSLAWLASEYPHLPPGIALRCAIEERRQREVLADAVPASTGDGARVLSVKQTADGSFDAEIVGPAGMSHADLLANLRDKLAESVLNLSGRRLAHVAVVGAGAKGAVRVRCSAVDPYEKTMTLNEVRDQ